MATLREAARQAMAHGVPGSASAYLERALREPPADRAAVLAELGRAEAPHAPRRAIEHFEAAIGLTAEPERRAGLALELGRAMHDTGRPADACAAFAQGMEDARRASSPSSSRRGTSRPRSCCRSARPTRTGGWRRSSPAPARARPRASARWPARA